MASLRIFILTIFLVLSNGNFLFAIEKDVRTIHNFKNGNDVIRVWDSLAVSQESIFKKLSIYGWIDPLEHFYTKAKAEKNTDLLIQLQYPLAYVYHSLTRFNECIPLFENLVTKKKHLTKYKYEMSLLKLEESYTNIGNLRRAIDVRKNRIAEGFVTNFWDVYESAGLFEEAIKDYKTSVLVPYQNDWDHMFHYFRLGRLFFKADALDSSMVNYEKAYAVSNKIINSDSYTGKWHYSEKTKYYFNALIKGNEAEILMLWKRYSEAIPWLKADIEQSKIIDEIGNAILKRLDLVECYLKLNLTKMARSYLDTASLLMKSTKLYYYDFKEIKARADYFDKVKQYDSAAFYLKRYLQLKDSIDANNKKNQALGMLTLLDADNQKATLAAQKLALSQSKIVEAEQRNQLYFLLFVLVILSVLSVAIFLNNRQKTRNKLVIEQSLREKELLLKEIHHRVKNNLQVISSLFDLQAASISDEYAKKVLLEGQGRIRSIALLHHQLYQQENITGVDLRIFAKDLYRQVYEVMHVPGVTVNCQMDIPETFLSLDTVIPLGLILNEIFTNAFKYAFKDADSPSLRIQLKQLEANKYVLSCCDNGPGLPKDFDILKSKSLGLRVITQLSKQIGGKMVYRYENGSCFDIYFVS